uniref:Tudor domain-containing protein n=1 Tax=Chenopodium quinoa TaxID=63459 RepID=A0A803MME9_CHEQI
MPITSILVSVQVIALTEELLETTKQNEIFVSAISTNASTSDTLRESNRISQSNNSAQAIAVFSITLCLVLMLKVSLLHFQDSINMLDREDRFPVGTKIQAVWSEDGEWYNATVEACTLNGYFVRFDEWGNKEEVDPANVRLLQGDDDDAGVDALLKAEKEAEATKQALKRKIAQAAAGDFQSRSLPAKLRINPDDPEDVKAAKRKKIHSFKSKARFEQLEVTQNKRQNAWQQFQSTKGRAKKVGFFSGRKKESIFKSPEDPQGKVGVTGSGKGLTDFQKREKHLHLKGANIDNENGEADD